MVSKWCNQNPFYWRTDSLRSRPPQPHWLARLGCPGSWRSIHLSSHRASEAEWSVTSTINKHSYSKFLTTFLPLIRRSPCTGILILKSVKCMWLLVSKHLWQGHHLLLFLATIPPMQKTKQKNKKQKERKRKKKQILPSVAGRFPFDISLLSYLLRLLRDSWSV